jgi:hypothetical protein
MAVKLDVKSMVIGLLVGVAVMLAAGAATDSARYATAVACNDVWIVFTRIDTRTGEIVARREAIGRLAPSLRVSMPADRPADADAGRRP